MQLYIIRHGSAEKENPDGDNARRLTEDGKKKMKKAGNFLKGQLDIDYLVSSPLTRAVQTAEILADVLDIPKKRFMQSDTLRPGVETEDTIAEVQALGKEKVAVVGHNPHLSDLCRDLIGPDCRGIDLKKGAVARIDFDGPARKEEGTLRWLVTMDVVGKK